MESTCKRKGPTRIVTRMGSGLKQNIRVRHINFRVQPEEHLLLLNLPLMALSTHTSSSQHRTSSPVGEADRPEEIGAAVWKRRYLALQESVNTEKSFKRKSQYAN